MAIRLIIPPIHGSNYYRIKAIDMDGGYVVSTKIEVQFHTALLSVFPNPSRGIVNIKGIEGHNIDYSVYNILGKEIIRGQMVHNSINLSQLIDGMYYLSMNGQVQRLLIEK